MGCKDIKCSVPPCQSEDNYGYVALKDANNIHKPLFPLTPIEYVATVLLIIIVSFRYKQIARAY